LFERYTTEVVAAAAFDCGDFYFFYWRDSTEAGEVYLAECCRLTTVYACGISAVFSTFYFGWVPSDFLSRISDLSSRFACTGSNSLPSSFRSSPHGFFYFMLPESTLFMSNSDSLCVPARPMSGRVFLVSGCFSLRYYEALLR